MRRKTHTNRADDLRQVTAQEEEAARALGMFNPGWYATWVDAGFTREQIAEWYPLTSYRTVVADAAARLSAAGWTPDDLRTAIAEVHTKLLEDCTAPDAETALREAVLWNEVAAYYDTVEGWATSLRDDMLCEGRRQGATLVELAKPFGWSKQYVAQITRRTQLPRAI